MKKKKGFLIDNARDVLDTFTNIKLRNQTTNLGFRVNQIQFRHCFQLLTHSFNTDIRLGLMIIFRTIHITTKNIWPIPPNGVYIFFMNILCFFLKVLIKNIQVNKFNKFILIVHIT